MGIDTLFLIIEEVSDEAACLLFCMLTSGNEQ
jgi:hypothetical protein